MAALLPSMINGSALRLLPVLDRTDVAAGRAVLVAVLRADRAALVDLRTGVAAATGHGHFDMMAYEGYHHDQLEDYEYPQEAVEGAMAHLPEVPAMG